MRAAAIGAALVALTLGAAGSPAAGATLCTLVVDAADGRVLREDGDCATRVTPASTFKIPLALMGFDSEVLRDAHAPVWTYVPGYPDWGGEAWKRPTDPTAWLRYSVVWYSQVLARRLGARRLTEYATRFSYGNADFTGDPGQDNGLERAWIQSSLKVSPREQVAFLRRLVDRRLPVSAHALDATDAVVEVHEAGNGWRLHGKTGTAYPRKPEGGFDETRGHGWYVGWARKDGRTLVFARLDQGDGTETASPGRRARAEWIADWPRLAASLAR